MNKFLSMSMCAALAFSIVACSDDNEPNDPNAGNVFPEGIPTVAEGYKITVNEEGKVTSLKDDYEEITFEYGNFTRANTFQVKMTINVKDYPSEGSVIYVQTNANGFATYAFQEYRDGDTDRWWFGYNGAGQLNMLKRTDGDDEIGAEVTEATYNGGDIVATKWYEVNAAGAVINQDDIEYCDFGYTNSNVKTPIANKGAIMLFDEVFGIDMDEMGPAYYAGLLGRATSNLPVKRAYRDSSDDEFYTFKWELNEKGLPVSLTTTEHYNSSSYDYTTIFKW